LELVISIALGCVILAKMKVCDINPPHFWLGDWPAARWTTMKAFLAYISALLNKCRRYLGVMPMWMAVPLRISADILIVTLVTLVVFLALYLFAEYLITGS
jgi:hypothetical protein